MTKPILELLKEDFNRLANPAIEHVLSEESIRYLLALYNDAGLLNNCTLIPSEQMFAHVEKTVQSEGRPNTHFQYMVEFGTRSHVKQYDAGSVHYCAVDLFITEDDQAMLLVADHYRGHHAHYQCFEQIT